MANNDEDQDLSAPRLAVEFAETVPTWRFREDFWHQKNGVKVQQEQEGILSSVYGSLLRGLVSRKRTRFR